MRTAFPPLFRGSIKSNNTPIPAEPSSIYQPAAHFFGVRFCPVPASEWRWLVVRLDVLLAVQFPEVVEHGLIGYGHGLVGGPVPVLQYHHLPAPFLLALVIVHGLLVLLLVLAFAAVVHSLGLDGKHHIRRVLDGPGFLEGLKACRAVVVRPVEAADGNDGDFLVPADPLQFQYALSMFCLSVARSLYGARA